jgi:DNA-binding protein Fis
MVHSIILHFIEITSLLIHSFLILVSMVTAVLKTYFNTLHGNDVSLYSAVADRQLENCTMLSEVPNDVLGNPHCIVPNTRMSNL